MAKSTKSARTTSTVNPVSAKVEAKQPPQEQKEERTRTPAAHWAVTVGDLKKGERCNGLEWPLTANQRKALRFNMADVCVLDGRATYKFGQKQFATPSAYNAYMAERYSYLSGLYLDVSNNYKSNPDTDVWVSSAKVRAEALKAENTLLEQKIALTEQMVEAVTSGNMELVAQLKEQIAAL